MVMRGVNHISGEMHNRLHNGAVAVEVLKNERTEIRFVSTAKVTMVWIVIPFTQDTKALH